MTLFKRASRSTVGESTLAIPAAGINTEGVYPWANYVDTVVPGNSMINYIFYTVPTGYNLYWGNAIGSTTLDGIYKVLYDEDGYQFISFNVMCYNQVTESAASTAFLGENANIGVTIFNYNDLEVTFTLSAWGYLRDLKV